MANRILNSGPRGRAAARARKHAGILVTGGAGYIGSVLVELLVAGGAKVRVLDSLMYGVGANSDLELLLSRRDVEVVACDCRDEQAVMEATTGIQTVVHLAAIVGDDACRMYKQAALNVNYRATGLLAGAAKANGVERFVFASSCSVYGVSENVADETAAPNAVSLYAQTKVDSERLLLEAASDNFHPSILRLATVFGLSHRPRFDLAVNLLSAQASTGGALRICNGDSWRPFIHVRDAAAGIVAVMHAPLDTVGGQVFNLGDSRLNYTFSQVAERIRVLNPGAVVTKVDSKDRRNYRVRFEKVKQRLGFRCARSLEYGIDEIRWALEANLLDYRDLRYYNSQFLERHPPAVFGPEERSQRPHGVQSASSGDLIRWALGTP